MLKKYDPKFVLLGLIVLLMSVLTWALYVNNSTLQTFVFEGSGEGMERIGGSEGDFSELENYQITPQKLNEYYSETENGAKIQVENVEESGKMQLLVE